jgi:hypothetical protein
MKSFNDLLVIKRVSLREFTTFKKMLAQSFSPILEGSLLVPICGAYTITSSYSTDNYIVM